jgi:segregation and condensation protein A
MLNIDEKENIDHNFNMFTLSLDGYEGPIDLLLSLARDHKIDLTKLSILPLAEQYLLFLDKALKKDIEIAAEYLVMGAWLAFLKSKLLLPKENLNETDNIDEMSSLLEFQLKRLEAIQNVSKLLFERYQLGIHFFKNGKPENFNINKKVEYDVDLFNLISTYGNIISKENNKTITIASSKLYAVEEAIERLQSLMIKTSGWVDLFDFLPKNIKDKLENRSAIASHFVASLELVKDGKVTLKQNNFNHKIYLNLKN